MSSDIMKYCGKTRAVLKRTFTATWTFLPYKDQGFFFFPPALFFFSFLGFHADFLMYWPLSCSSEPECKWTLLGLRCPLLERFPGQGSGPARNWNGLYRSRLKQTVSSCNVDQTERCFQIKSGKSNWIWELESKVKGSCKVSFLHWCSLIK